MHNVDYIFYVDALKQVPSCEFFLVETEKTNVWGTENVLTALLKQGVKKTICLLIDKAAYPVNVISIGHTEKMYETLFRKDVEQVKGKLLKLSYI